MRKTDKKTDNELRAALTRVCDKALKEIAGFQWLTHLVNYQQFPNSLKVVCVFDCNEHLSSFLKSSAKSILCSLIQTELQGMNVKIKNIENHVIYDTEENCDIEHKGNWAKHLS